MKSNPIPPHYYPAHITAEELQRLPRAEVVGRVCVVEDELALAEAVHSLLQAQVIGIDTETPPSFETGKRNAVSLLQMATMDVAYLIRLNRVGLPEAIREILSSGEILKVGLGLKEDVSALRRIEPFEGQAFVELQKLCPAYGIVDQSLQKIYGIVCGAYLSKSQRLTNWSRKELSDGQIRYAALDAWAPLQIFLDLMSKPAPHPIFFAQL